jgi:hypothetical protein
MAFEYEVDVPNEDGDGTTKHTLVFKPITQVPIGVMRRNRHDYEAQLWASFEWGLGAEQMELFDRLSFEEFLPILAAWRAHDDEPVEKPAAKKGKAVEASDDDQDVEG